jgi:membrane-associated phospholipid phosphatase
MIIPLFKSSTKQILLGYFIVCCMLELIALTVPPLQFTYWVNGFHTSFLDVAAAIVTNLGNGVVIFVGAALFLFYRYYLAAGLAINGIIQGFIVTLFKHVWFADAMRPIASLDTSLVHFVEGVEVYRLRTFPSGHAVTAFGLAIFISLCLRNRTATIVSLSMAILIGLSRVYLLEHFLTDVAIGAAIGSVIGAASYYAFSRLEKSSRWSGSITFHRWHEKSKPGLSSRAQWFRLLQTNPSRDKSSSMKKNQ